MCKNGEVAMLRYGFSAVSGIANVGFDPLLKLDVKTLADR